MGDVERKGSQLDAARAKIAAIFENMPEMQVGLASEGSFGPHPAMPIVAVGRELVLMIDRRTGLEVTGHDITFDTNFGHVLASDAETALAFAKRIGFPEQGVIVSDYNGNRGRSSISIKDIEDGDVLRKTVMEAMERSGAALVRSDMRAHRNPQRMNAIGRATKDLIARLDSRCPQCGRSAFVIVDRISGLPC